MFSFTDLSVIVLSLAIVIGVALRAGRRKPSGTEYFLAGRDLTWPFVGMSLFMTNISAEHVIGLAGDGYRVGLVVGGFEWMGALDLIILATLFVPLYLRAKIFTIPEFLERRFGWGLRAFLSVNLLIINVLTKISIALWAGSLLITTLFGWNQMFVMICISAFTVLYTMKGGLRAVVYADMIQGFWLILGGIVLTSVGLVSVGGWNELTARAPGGMIEMVKPLNHELPITGFWISNVLAGMFYWCMDQTSVQRVLGAASIKDGQKGAIFAGFLKLLTPFILVLPGIIARILYPDLQRYDMAYAHLAGALLPVGVRGLVLAGLIAALMSSLSATYNSSATLVTRDFVLRFRPRLTDRRQVIVGRSVTGLMAILGLLAAPLVGLSVTIWHYLQTISAYLSIPMAATIFLGLLWKRVNTTAAVTAVSVGFATGLVFFLDQALGWSLPVISHPYLHSFLHRTLLVWIIAAATMIGVTLATTRVEQESGRELESGFGGIAQPWTRFGDYRTWAILLFLCIASLWWVFR